MTTLTPTTPVPTTLTISTFPPTTPPALLPTISCARMFRYRTRELVARAWVDDESGELVDVLLAPRSCWMELFSEGVSRGRVVGSEDPAGTHFVSFRLPQILPQPGHAYFLRVHLELAGGVSLGQRDFPLGTT